MNQNQKIVIVLVVVFLVAIGLHNFNSTRSLGDRLDANTKKVLTLEGASVTHVTREQVKAALDKALTESDGLALVELKNEITTERDEAISAALVPLTEKVISLDTTVNSTKAVGLKTALAKLSEASKRHDAVIYGKERGIVRAITALAERHNAEHATADVNSTDVAAVRAAEAGAELDANSRESLSPFDRMVAAVKGLSAKQFQDQKKIRVAARDVPVPQIIRITVRGDQVKVEKVPVPALRHVKPPQ